MFSALCSIHVSIPYESMDSLEDDTEQMDPRKALSLSLRARTLAGVIGETGLPLPFVDGAGFGSPVPATLFDRLDGVDPCCPDSFLRSGVEVDDLPSIMMPA
jgi:hypothetical protein